MAGPSETVGDLGEFGLIRRLRDLLDGSGSAARHRDAPSLTSSETIREQVIVGIGDDAAVLRPDPRSDWVLTCDLQIAGVHFLPQWMDAHRIGSRAMTVNLSDLAAMGAEPQYALISLGLPLDMLVSDVLQLYRGFLDAPGAAEVRIVGGNLAGSGPDWFCDITLIGHIERGRALGRGGARPGDRILVTGMPGKSAAGLALLRHLEESHGPKAKEMSPGLEPDLRPRLQAYLDAEPWARPLIEAYLSPVARLPAGRSLAASGVVTALIDVSDGLSGDLLHICEESDVRGVLNFERLPLYPDLEVAGDILGRAPWTWSLLPSDDYELLFTLPASEADRVANDLHHATGLRVTDVGEIESGPPGVDVRNLPPGAALPGGWNHFAR